MGTTQVLYVTANMYDHIQFHSRVGQIKYASTLNQLKVNANALQSLSS